jgi:hypothetical protein
MIELLRPCRFNTLKYSWVKGYNWHLPHRQITGQPDEDINTSTTIIPSIEILGTTIKSSGELVLMLLRL